MADQGGSEWPDPVREILMGDQAVALGHVTPAAGVVLTPLTNTGIVEPGRITPVTSSIGASRKLDRIVANPKVAVAFHTRRHGFSRNSEYVLVQGRATHSPLSDRGWIDRHREQWERFSGPRDVGPLWERWLRIYHWRVALSIEVERLVVWPSLDCRGEPLVIGSPLPARPVEPQAPPRKGAGPRVDARRAARRAARLENRLVAWVGADGYPVIVPFAVHGADGTGLGIAAAVPVPGGGRRAGLLAHEFARYTMGQRQRRHTGWLEGDGSRDAIYAPHTASGYSLPPSRFLYRLSAGFVTRRGYRASGRG